jgi:hypothetical protein
MRTLKKAGVLSDRTKFSCLLQGIGIRGYIQNSRSAPRKSTTTLGYLVKPEKKFGPLPSGPNESVAGKPEDELAQE